MIKRYSILLILFFIVHHVCFAQQIIKFTKTINWHYELKTLKEGTQPTPILNADDILLDANAVPTIIIPHLLEEKGEIRVVLENVKTSLANATLIAPSIQQNLTTEFTYRTFVSTQNKKPSTTLAIVGLRINGAHEIEILTSFDLEITRVPSLNKTIGSTNFKANSVLATGDIYKLAITTTGLYKLDYNFLKSLGFNMNTINPKNIHIYGKGGGMLPRANSTFREDDLPENAIYVKGEADAKFDAQDYAVFYGKNQAVWNYSNGKYTHKSNYYDETTYYFLTIDALPGKRISTSANPGSPNVMVTSGDEYYVHELNKVNDYQSGAELLGESFNKNSIQNFAFTIPNIIPSEPIRFRTSEMAHSVSAITSFNVSNLGSPICSRSCNTIIESFDQPYYSAVSPIETSFLATSDNFNIQYEFDKNGNSEARGWLDYFELVARRNLVQGGGQMSFRDSKSIAPSAIAQFNLTTSQASTVWDVTNGTDVKQYTTSFSGTTTSFQVETSTYHEFISFTDAVSNFFVPVNRGKVANQNLHASGFADLIIVTYPDFLDQANRLAEHRRKHDGLRVLVTTPQLIYHEFSSGAQDITAIREFLRMLYNRATTAADEPKYLLLFGDASFNYKESKVFLESDNRFYENTNFVPTYESDNFYDTDSYASDDYFGLLDDDEGLWLPNDFEALDVGIGRIPVGNTLQAEQMVDKILRYESPEALGDWRNSLMFIADDQEQNSHLNESQQVSDIVAAAHTDFNLNKIYLDAYKQLSLGSGYAYPDATDAVNRGLQRGTLVLNYTGHGSSVQLAHESLITATRDIVNWKNKYTMPVFVTATCEFTEFDHLAKVSAGEDVILNPNGGGIALLTTTRVAYSNINLDLNTNFNRNNAFEKTAQGGGRLGDIMKVTKNTNSRNSSPSSKHFILLGDPSMRLAVPKYNVITTKINNQIVTTSNDTFRALQKVSIEGLIADFQNNPLPNFNGEVSIIVYDKPGTYSTLANDADSYKQSFTMQKNFVFKGIAAVNHGVFKIDFVIPKDIVYNYGLGKISYYAFDRTNNVDGAGSYTKVVIGGSDINAVSDTKGPVIKLFINDTLFRNGGTSHQNPILIAQLFDENGINTSGVSVGHEMTATLDGDLAHPSVLNDFYEGVLNDFQRGKISYPYYNLGLGNHTITLKVWDIYNNSGTGSINFIIVDKSELKIDKLLCYPNPFNPGNGNTIFSFEHNKAGEAIEVTIDIYTVIGEKLMSFYLPQNDAGGRFNDLNWNGENEFGAAMPSGTYIFKATVKDKNGNTAQQSSRLVIVR